ncbi:MAG TPA: hypothetical protein VJQ85_09835 [Gaiellaceae bacterium]|nr:hypothetical protein [Gaiellaceae bacterium]
MRRFADVITRQLDLFEDDDLLVEVHDAKARYDRAPRDEAEEAFGDYMDVVDSVKDALADMRDAFARTLDEDAAEEYEAAFERAARKRWRWLG